MNAAKRYFFIVFLIIKLSSHRCEAVRPGTPLETVPYDGIPWNFKPSRRIIAIGDIHGDATALLTILRNMNVIDDQGRWIGKNVQAVLDGDLINHGFYSRIVSDLVMNWEDQAPTFGSAIHSLLGNHEHKMTEGEFSYTEPLDALLFANPSLIAYGLTQFSSPLEALPLHKAMIEAFSGDSIYAQWIRQRNTFVRIGETLFVHGGVEKWALETDLGRINSTVRAWLSYFQNHNPEAPSPPLNSFWVMDGGKKGLPRDEIEGPLWTRKTAKHRLEPQVFRDILKKLGVKRIVIGHTTENTPIRTDYDNALFMIDTGISTSYGGVLSALKIENGKATPYMFERPQEEHPLVLESLERWKKGERVLLPPSCSVLLSNAGRASRR